MTSLRTRILLLAAGLFLLMLAVGFWWTRPRPLPRLTPPRAEVEAAAPAGEIFGLTIGSRMEEARAKLDPRRDPAGHVPDAKEESGRRIYWKLKDSPEIDWIMAWANEEGKITRLRAVFRPETTKQFREFGDLAQAASVTPNAAKWNLRAQDGTRYRLIAQGEAGRVRTVYLFALPRFNDESAAAEADEEEDE